MTRMILRKTLVVTSLMGATILATGALAGPAVEQDVWTFYYIALNPTTNRCNVVDVKPTPDGVFAVVYESRALADLALAQASAYEIPDCSSADAKAVVAKGLSITARAGATQDISEATGGQTEARAHYLANRDGFASVTPPLTAAQRQAAEDDGRLEGPLAVAIPVPKG